MPSCSTYCDSAHNSRQNKLYNYDSHWKNKKLCWYWENLADCSYTTCACCLVCIIRVFKLRHVEQCAMCVKIIHRENSLAQLTGSLRLALKCTIHFVLSLQTQWIRKGSWLLCWFLLFSPYSGWASGLQYWQWHFIVSWLYSFFHTSSLLETLREPTHVLL